jgi:hypothetical protein
MSDYLILMRTGDIDFSKFGPAEGQALVSRFVEWTQELQRGGHYVAVERLKDDRGKTLRKRGDSIVVDGPYAEGKEIVMGFYVLRADSWDEATALARGCPILAIGGTVELRETEAFPRPR